MVDGPDPSRPRPKYSWKEEFYNPSNFYSYRGLPIQESTTDKHMISVANGIFVQQGFNIRPDFKLLAEKLYNCELKDLNFAGNPTGSADYINKYVAKVLSIYIFIIQNVSFFYVNPFIANPFIQITI